MPFVPTGRLVVLAALPVLMGIGVVFTRALMVPMLALDGAVLLLAVLDAVWGRRAVISVRRELPRGFSLGRPNAVTLRVGSQARRPLRVLVNEDRPAELPADDLPLVLDVPAQAQVRAVYHLRPTRRGQYALGDHHVRYPTPLGLWYRQLRLRAENPAPVYPDLQAVRAYELLARQSRENLLVRAVRLRGGENEFERLRDHQRDDEFRSIDWKATARRGKLTAREYQQERNQSVMCLLDCGRLMAADAEGLSQLDHALNAVLMMSHVAARAGDRVGLCAFDEQVRVFVSPTSGRRAAAKVLQASYDVHARLVEPDFDAVFAYLHARLHKRSLVVLFTQLVDDVSAQAVLRLVRALPPRHLPLVVLFRDLAIERLSEGEEGAGGDDLYLRAAAAEALTWRDRLVRDLRAGGALVLPARPGQLTPDLIKRYLEIKAQHLL